MGEFFEKLKCIKKQKNNETRLKRLKEVCRDREILNDALELSKHESTINLPGASFITAIAAFFKRFLRCIDPQWNRYCVDYFYLGFDQI
jgi:hypothetical protein